MLWQILVAVVIGALCGWLGSLIGIGGGWVMSIILSIAGACLVIFLWRLLFKKGKKK